MTSLIVDTAAELPPRDNLSRYVELGAAAAVFSGGKVVRGPQSTGDRRRRAVGDPVYRAPAPPGGYASGVLDTPEELMGTGALSEDTPNHGIRCAIKVGKDADLFIGTNQA